MNTHINTHSNKIQKHTHTQGRTNIAPEKVPWDAFRTLLAQCIYGGKIDNQFDQVGSVCVCACIYVCLHEGFLHVYTYREVKQNIST